MANPATRRRQERTTLRRTLDSLRAEVVALKRRRDAIQADIARYHAAVQAAAEMVALADRHGIEVPRELRELRLL